MWQTLAQAVDGTGLSQWVAATYWLWPILEIIHFIGLSLLLGGLIVIDLRMAGHFRRFDPQATHQLLPLVIAGFTLNLLTGILFFFGDPFRYAVNIGFQIKMVLVLLAGCNVVVYYLKIYPQMRSWGADTRSPVNARLVAYTSLAVWGGVLLCGRLIPYVGTG